MTKILIDKETVELALEALETLDSGDTYKTHNSATALRQALEQSTEQEPVAWSHNSIRGNVITHRPADLDRNPDRWIPLYTQPQEAAPLKPLTDDEIWKDDGIMAANSGYGATFETLRGVVRAIEAAHGITGENE